MDNYAHLLEHLHNLQVRTTHLMEYGQVPTYELAGATSLAADLAKALITVSSQNRNLRADLELTKRDYEANLEELLTASEYLKALQETIYAEVNGIRYIVDPRLKNPVAGVYDPELKEALG